MKKGRKIMTAVAQKLQIPEAVIADLSTIAVAGFSRVSIEHHNGLMEYDPQTILVKVKDGTVRVAGQGLEVALMKEDLLEIVGQISEILLLEGVN